jgi:hypothetical protein
MSASLPLRGGEASKPSHWRHAAVADPGKITRAGWSKERSALQTKCLWLLRCGTARFAAIEMLRPP